MDRGLFRRSDDRNWHIEGERATVDAHAKTADDLNDLEIAHVAYTAVSIDIRYAHLARAMSGNPVVRSFAHTIIRDHAAVNEKALEPLQKLNVSARDNVLSRQLTDQSEQRIKELSQLRGDDFDRRYAANWKNPLHKLTKTSVSGGGLSLGATRDYAVELKEGVYVYSCPLNPTPDDRPIVGG